MVKQGLSISLAQVQKLSPLQIQTAKLIELPTLELEQRIQKELEDNPILDEAEEAPEDGTTPQNISLSQYKDADQIPSYKLAINNQGKDLKPQYNTFAVKESFHQNLISQIGMLPLDEKNRMIAEYIVGMIGDDGYLRRDILSLADDIEFKTGISVSENEVEEMLEVIQGLEPAGVGARDLRECLSLQLAAKKQTPEVKLASAVINDYFVAFTKKHFSKIMDGLGVDEEGLKAAIGEIRRLNPKPGGQIDDSYSEQAQQIIPDFILEKEGDELNLTIPRYNIPELRVNRRYADELLEAAKGDSRQGKEAAAFVKKKLDSAKWFIEAIKQRYNTLYNTMSAIIDYQKEYFEDGDETKLKPMVLKNIAEKAGCDISTVSRVANSKYIQTHFGVFPVKYFFSEGMTNKDGEEVSTREIKSILSACIGEEDKRKPLTDDELVEVLSSKGYNIARRTVAKYREQLSIPIARMRKEL